MSIICYFLNIENFAGSLRRQLRLQHRREQRLINIANRQKLMAQKKGLSQVEINIQDVQPLVSKIKFFVTKYGTEIIEEIKTDSQTLTKKSRKSQLTSPEVIEEKNVVDNIKELKIYNNNKEINTDDIFIDNVITFNEPTKIKKISFVSNQVIIGPTDTTPVTTTKDNLEIKMQFLDSDDKIINEIITEPRNKFNFILPPYTQKEVTSRTRIKNAQNAKLMSLTKTTMGALKIARDTTLTAIANLAKYKAAERQTDSNITVVKDNLKKCDRSIAKFEVAKIEFSKNFDTVISNLKRSPSEEYKKYMTEGKNVNLDTISTETILKKERELSSFAIKNLYIIDIDDSRLTSSSFVLDDETTTPTFEPTDYNTIFDDQPKIEYALESETTYSPALSSPGYYNNKEYYTTSSIKKNIKLIYKLTTPTILKRISFKNGYSELSNTNTLLSTTKALTIKGVTIRCLDISGAIIDEMIIREILDTVTLTPKPTVINDIKSTMLTRDNLTSAEKTLIAGLTELRNSVKVQETSSKSSDDTIADNSINTYLDGMLDSTSSGSIEGFTEENTGQKNVPVEKNILENAVDTAKSAELFTAKNALKAANNEVIMAIDELTYALSFSEYNNDYVSDNYIILIKEQQKKTLIPALKGSKNAIQSLEDILYKTKLQSSISTHPKLQELKKLDETGTILLQLLNK